MADGDWWRLRKAVIQPSVTCRPVHTSKQSFGEDLARGLDTRQFNGRLALPRTGAFDPQPSSTRSKAKLRSSH
jgi:hypothetical protein